MKILREAGDSITLALAVRRLGQVALHEDDYDTAIAFCTESLSLNVKTGDFRGTLACLSAIAGYLCRAGRRVLQPNCLAQFRLCSMQ